MNVYRPVYEHLTRLQPDARTRYLKRLLVEQPVMAQESDFQKIAQYYGVPVHEYGELTAPLAAQAALVELSQQLAPNVARPDDVPKLIGFARRLRDAMEVFLKCFVSLRDGYQEFETEVLRREGFEQQGNRVGIAKDHVEPAAVEQSYERKGKRGGLFSNKYEGLWKEYQTVHGDYLGEDKETFLIIFGPQFSRAYAATSGEAYQVSGGGGSLLRPTMHANPSRR
jgi:type VI secretion system protein ImpI